MAFEQNPPPRLDDPRFWQWLYVFWSRTSAIVASTLSWASITGKPTTLSGYGITDAQPLDADLTAIAALNTTGYAKRTGANTWILDAAPSGGGSYHIDGGAADSVYTSPQIIDGGGA